MAHQLSDGAVEEIFWKGATGAQSGQAYILQASPASRSFVSRFSTTQFVAEQEGWLADLVFGVYGWLQVNDVKKNCFPTKRSQKA